MAKASAGIGDQRVIKALESQQNTRLAGIPTVSTLAGPPGLGYRLWRDWAATRGWRVLIHEGGLDWELCQKVAAHMEENPGLLQAATTLAAPLLGLESAHLAAKLENGTGLDLEVLLSGLDRTDLAPETRALVHCLFEDLHQPTCPAALCQKARAMFPNPTAFLKAMVGLWPKGFAQALILMPRRRNGGLDAWLQRSIPSAGEISEKISKAPVALAADPLHLQTALRSEPETRAKAICRSGLVRLEPATSNGSPGFEPRGQAEANPASPSRSLNRLLEDGADQVLLDTFESARVKLGQAGNRAWPLGVRGARSAAEAFLFLRLESLSETAGFFKLNRRLVIPFGQRDYMEVDLFAEELSLAIEIDGYYHFQNSRAYRRDREKDYLLQRNGIWILRFTAPDVVARLDEVLDRVLDAMKRLSASKDKPRGA